MRTLTITELNCISGGNKNQTEVAPAPPPVIIYQAPSVSTLFLRDLAYFTLELAFRLMIEAAYYNDDNCYYDQDYDEYYCY